MLSLVVLPSIHLSGPSHPIPEGDSVNLTCNVTAGLPSPQLRWSKNGEDLEDNSAVLFLREVTENDEGRYTCEARNLGGSSVDDVQVNVQGKFISCMKVLANIMQRQIDLCTYSSEKLRKKVPTV